MKNKFAVLAIAVVALFALQAFAFISVKNNLEEQISNLQSELQSTREEQTAQVSNISGVLDTVTDRIGVTAKDIEDARHTAELLKQEQTKTATRLRDQLVTNSQAVDALRQEATSKLDEATSKLAEVESSANNQFGAVSTEVQTVKLDLDAAKTDLATRMVDLRDSLGREIAKNSSEVAQLRLRGERDYFEFDILKNTKSMQRIADIQLQLKKADTKNQKYDVLMLVDDGKMEKKGQAINEPVQFLVGRDRLRYELVVNSVDKDRIRGYVSTPRDKVLSAEAPAFRR